MVLLLFQLTIDFSKALFKPIRFFFIFGFFNVLGNLLFLKCKPPNIQRLKSFDALASMSLVSVVSGSNQPNQLAVPSTLHLLFLPSFLRPNQPNQLAGLLFPFLSFFLFLFNCLINLFVNSAKSFLILSTNGLLRNVSKSSSSLRLSKSSWEQLLLSFVHPQSFE